MIKLELPKEERRKGKVKIKIGAAIGHDFGFFKWPGCKPPEYEFDEGEKYQFETKYPDAIFTIKDYDMFQVAGKYMCIRPGYGEKGNYGNGSISVSEEDLEFMEEE